MLAIDGGHPARTGTTAVVITLDDVNDDAPTFAQPTYSFTIPEKEPAGSFVGIVLASDRDLPPNNAIRYSFAHENSATDSFFIDPYNGTLSSRVELNREDQPVYYLMLAATDPGTPPLTGTVSVVIFVTDVNDNSPVFEHPSSTNNTIQVSNRATRGYVITTLAAKDADSGNNAKIVYRLQQASEGSKNAGNTDIFTVDPVLGTVYVNRELSDIDLRTFHLTVFAEDLGEPPRSTPAHLIIVVNKTAPFIFTAELQQEMREKKSVIAVAVVIGFVCLLILVGLIFVLVLMRRRHTDTQDPAGNGVHLQKSSVESSVDSRMEAVKMLTPSSRENGGSSNEGTPIKASFNAYSLTSNNNTDHNMKEVSCIDQQSYLIPYLNSGSGTWLAPII